MRLFNSKGDLFGKINIVDLLLVTFILSSFPLLAVSYKNFNKRMYKAEEIIKFENVVITVECPLLPVVVCRAVSVKDEDVRNTNDYWAILEGIQLSDSRLYYVDNHPADLTVLRAANIKENKSAVFTIRLKVKKLGGQYFFSNQILKIGGGFNFSTSKYDLAGLITDIKVGTEKAAN